MAFITVRDAEGCFPRVLQGHFGLVCHVLYKCSVECILAIVGFLMGSAIYFGVAFFVHNDGAQIYFMMFASIGSIEVCVQVLRLIFCRYCKEEDEEKDNVVHPTAANDVEQAQPPAQQEIHPPPMAMHPAIGIPVIGMIPVITMPVQHI